MGFKFNDELPKIKSSNIVELIAQEIGLELGEETYNHLEDISVTSELISYCEIDKLSENMFKCKELCKIKKYKNRRTIFRILGHNFENEIITIRVYTRFPYLIKKIKTLSNKLSG